MSLACSGLLGGARRAIGSTSRHRGLGELYVSDSRFTENIDRVRPGLAQFMRDAFRANAERAAR